MIKEIVHVSNINRTHNLNEIYKFLSKKKRGGYLKLIQFKINSIFLGILDSFSCFSEQLSTPNVHKTYWEINVPTFKANATS